MGLEAWETHFIFLLTSLSFSLCNGFLHPPCMPTWRMGCHVQVNQKGTSSSPRAGWAGNLQSSGHFCGLGTSAHVPPHSPLHTLPTSHLKSPPYLCPRTYSFCLEKAELESSTIGTRASSSDPGSQRASPQARF